MNNETNSIYSQKWISSPCSRRYILIEVKNVPWVLNRITALFKRRNYNIEQLNLSFNQDKSKAYMLIALDGEAYDIEQVIHQIEKLYDVIQVKDVSHEKQKKYYNFYVETDKNLCAELDFSPTKTVNFWERCIHIFTVNSEWREQLEEELKKKNIFYKFELLNLIY